MAIVAPPYTWKQFTDEVKKLLTVDANRLGTADFIARQIRAAVLNLQRFKPLEVYRKGHQDILLPSAFGNEGACSKLTLTQGAQIRDAYMIRQKSGKENLTGTVANNPSSTTIVGIGTAWLSELIPGDLIEFNGDGSVFTVLQILSDTSMVLDFGSPFTGLEHTLKKYTRYRHACAPWDWEDRHTLLSRQACLTDNRPLLALAPTGGTALIHPQVLSSDADGFAGRLEVNWDGVKIEWGDNDITPFDEAVVGCVADWVKGEVFRHVNNRLDLWGSFLEAPRGGGHLGGTFYQKRADLARAAHAMAHMDS